LEQQPHRVSPPVQLQSLQASVQHNCHISDARFASDFTMCVYLLKMREYYRWEMGYSYAAVLAHDEVGEWLTRREHLWETLEEKPFIPLEIDGKRYDPFDADLINEVLAPHGLVYSAGYGAKAKPHFFLARLERHSLHEGYRIHISAEEYARDLSAPPAMSQNAQIFIRRESLRRMLWERLEEWRWNRLDNAMGRALQCYDFERDLDGALEAMTDTEIRTLMLHEIGEVQAGRELGECWRDMIDSFPRSRLELMSRAVRDHLADALSTLPTLLQEQHAPSLHFYFANLSGMRKQIYPALLKAYQYWVEYADTSRLEEQIARGREHWLQVARDLLELHESRVKNAWRDMESLIENKQL
jgi:Family of unknown function (DUF6866) C-terminal domain/Family of unknown function (DUF6866) N-terminal domain